jgi:hypothetical protein
MLDNGLKLAKAHGALGVHIGSARFSRGSPDQRMLRELRTGYRQRLVENNAAFVIVAKSPRDVLIGLRVTNVDGA